MTDTWADVEISTPAQTRRILYTYIHTYIHMHKHIYKYLSSYTCCIYIHNMHIYMYIYILYVCVCTHIYIYMHTTERHMYITRNPEANFHMGPLSLIVMIAHLAAFFRRGVLFHSGGSKTRGPPIYRQILNSPDYRKTHMVAPNFWKAHLRPPDVSSDLVFNQESDALKPSSSCCLSMCATCPRAQAHLLGRPKEITWGPKSRTTVDKQYGQQQLDTWSVLPCRIKQGPTSTANRNTVEEIHVRSLSATLPYALFGIFWVAVNEPNLIYHSRDM